MDWISYLNNKKNPNRRWDCIAKFLSNQELFNSRSKCMFRLERLQISNSQDEFSCVG